MGKGTLTIYNASAGSGKTYTLTGIYLSGIFKSRYNYRKILAVTFTNKATAEMKLRILENLHKLSSGEKCEYLTDLINEKKQSEEWIRKEAGEILNAMLHDFSRFSVSTIDSFFQKILRAFAREAGLHTGFNIELDHSVLLASAVDEMIASASVDDQLKNWLIKYAISNIDDEKSWNLKTGIMNLAQELFREKFKILSADERSKLENKQFLLEYIGKLKTVSSSFEKRLPELGKKAAELFARFELTDEMFYRKGQGIPRFIRSLVKGEICDPNCYVREILSDSPRWSTNSAASQLQAAIKAGLDNVLIEAIHFYDDNISGYSTAKAILSNIYALGILSDVLNNIHKITTSENIFLLSDAGELLNLITKADQCPFIYEKVGNRFENFMIDEFQDTSIIQWNNFSSLIDNSMSQGFDNLVVGDIKQAIYRWRNSDWRILGSVLAGQIDNDRFIGKSLSVNWRSRSNIIKFNNAFFSLVPFMLDVKLKEEGIRESLSELYTSAVQEDPGNNPGGFVKLEFIENEDDNIWQNKVLKRLPEVIESFQDKGYNASDIGIIVRNGREGSMVLKTLIDYSNNCPEEKKSAHNYNVVSNDSLLLSNSPVINFIISVISVQNDPANLISRATMLRFYLLAIGEKDADKAPLIYGGPVGYFPEGYDDFISGLKEMPLFEAIENIILFFGLGKYSWNAAYINTFQDYVLGFTGNGNPDIQSFLEWWDTTGCRKSVVLPGNQEAMRILTIHKSKGLEFPVVILPFLSWNLDHQASKQPLLWVRPEVAPFNELGIVPVRCNKDLANTIFSDYYYEEKYSSCLDNLNLLYVALTRAKDAIYGFSVNNPRSGNCIAGILKEVLVSDKPITGKQDFILSTLYDTEKNIFEFGNMPGNEKIVNKKSEVTSSGYRVTRAMESLKLKLHGENYFSSEDPALRKKINYGKLMHEIFEGINTPSDIHQAVRKLLLEGKLPEEEAEAIEARVELLISNPSVAGWFSSENQVMREAGILLTSGNIRRPDRVIFKDGKTTVIDFKFGEENDHYVEQVELYRSLLLDMGYKNVDAYIWYVDKNKIVTA